MPAATGACVFPALPSYQAFNRRFGQLAAAFEHLVTVALRERVAGLAWHADHLIDSLPIVLAKWPRCATACVTAEVADQGYYYGVKLHAIALRRRRELPLQALLHLSRASQYDLQALSELWPDLGWGDLFSDKAYADAEIKQAPLEPYILFQPHVWAAVRHNGIRKVEINRLISRK